MIDWLIQFLIVGFFISIGAGVLFTCWRWRCPNCKSRKLESKWFQVEHIYHSDNRCSEEYWGYWKCVKCGAKLSEYAGNLKLMSPEDWEVMAEIETKIEGAHNKK